MHGWSKRPVPRSAPNVRATAVQLNTNADKWSVCDRDCCCLFCTVWPVVFFSTAHTPAHTHTLIATSISRTRLRGTYDRTERRFYLPINKRWRWTVAARENVAQRDNATDQSYLAPRTRTRTYLHAWLFLRNRHRAARECGYTARCVCAYCLTRHWRNGQKNRIYF